MLTDFASNVEYLLFVEIIVLGVDGERTQKKASNEASAIRAPSDLYIVLQGF